MADTRGEVLYTREQLKRDERLSPYGDILSAVMAEGESCTVKQAEKKINGLLGKKLS